VLVAGGYNTDDIDKWLADALVYDFNTSVWTDVSPTYSHGTYHTATLMANGQVLVVGGCLIEGFCNDAVEIFEPTTNEWLEMTPLDFSLFGHTAQLLNNGRVLVAGGMSDEDTYPNENAVVYDPEQDAWIPTGPMIDPRYFAESVRLSDGRVLVVGGLSIEALPEHSTLSSAEIYDPATNQWTAAGSLSQARYAFQLVRLSDRHVLAIGGTRSHESTWNANSFVSEIERYDTTTKTWRTIGLLPRPAAFAASVLLPDGRVWLAGGRNNTMYFQDTWFITNAP
jgi:N-acetylneuraminic acid mutarotase